MRIVPARSLAIVALSLAWMGLLPASSVLGPSAAYAADKSPGSWDGTIRYTRNHSLHLEEAFSTQHQTISASVIVKVVGTTSPFLPEGWWALQGTFSETYTRTADIRQVSFGGDVCLIHISETLEARDVPIEGYLQLVLSLSPQRYAAEVQLRASTVGQGVETIDCQYRNGTTSQSRRAYQVGPHVPRVSESLEPLDGVFDPDDTFTIADSVAIPEFPPSVGQQITGWSFIYNPRSSNVPPTASPFSPPVGNDRTFVTESGTGLDTGCTYRKGGPLEIRIDVTRHVSAVDHNGRLVNASTLKDHGVVAPFAVLRLPAFDVDSSPSTGEAPEVDSVTFNGVPIFQVESGISSLTGINDGWELNEFYVPIEVVAFPERAAFGSTPEPRANVVRVNIDEGSAPDERWCTAIDWASLSIGAMSPTVLVHGNNSDAGFWDRHLFSFILERSGLPYDGCRKYCQQPLNIPTASVQDNGDFLWPLIPGIVRSFGADSYHIIAHSKGGLDSRQYLSKAPSDLQLLSHTTLSTPHNGSLLADLSVARGVSLLVLRQTKLMGFPAFTAPLLALKNLMGPDDGAKNLTTTFTQAFNIENGPQLPPGDYNRVAADNDRDGSGSVNIEREVAALRFDDPILAGLGRVNK